MIELFQLILCHRMSIGQCFHILQLVCLKLTIDIFPILIQLTDIIGTNGKDITYVFLLHIVGFTKLIIGILNCSFKEVSCTFVSATCPCIFESSSTCLFKRLFASFSCWRDCFNRFICLYIYRKANKDIKDKTLTSTKYIRNRASCLWLRSDRSDEWCPAPQRCPLPSPGSDMPRHSASSNSCRHRHGQYHPN